MTCKDARKRWQDRLDQGGLEAELDQHMAACESCRTYAARMKRLVGLMEELHHDTELLALPATGPRLHAAPGRRRDWAMQTWHLLRIAAAIAIVVGAGLWLRTPRALKVENRTTETVTPALQGITLRAQSRERFIAVAAPSGEPNVQTFWLYPSVKVTEIRNRS